jgi:hypothetical protein
MLVRLVRRAPPRAALGATPMHEGGVSPERKSPYRVAHGEAPLPPGVGASSPADVAFFEAERRKKAQAYYAIEGASGRLHYAIEHWLPPETDPLVHLARDVRDGGGPSNEWLDAWADPGEPSSLARAWQAARYAREMLYLLERTGHAAHEEAAIASWRLREYATGFCDGTPSYNPESFDIRRLVPTPPTTIAGAVAALNDPPRPCPVSQFLFLVEFDPAGLTAWAERWGENGREPMRTAWGEATSARCMDRLLAAALGHRASQAAQAAVERIFGGSLGGRPEHHCAAALRCAVPDPPTFASIARSREAFVEALRASSGFWSPPGLAPGVRP